MKEKKKLKFDRICIGCVEYPKKCKGSIEPKCCAGYKPRAEEENKKIDFRRFFDNGLQCTR